MYTERSLCAILMAVTISRTDLLSLRVQELSGLKCPIYLYWLKTIEVHFIYCRERKFGHRYKPLPVDITNELSVAKIKRRLIKTMYAMGIYVMVLCVAFVTMVTAGSGSAPLNLNPLMSTYLGGGTDSTTNTITAVAVDKMGNVYVTGSGSYNYGLSGSKVKGSGNGFVLVINSYLHATMIYRKGGTITDIRLRDIGNPTQFLLQGDFGISVQKSSLGNVAWEKEMDCSQKYCKSDISYDGNVAVLDLKGKKIHSYNALGNEVGVIDAGTKHGHHPQDIAIDPINKRIVYARFFQAYPHHVPVQVPCVETFTYNLQVQDWRDYCVGSNEDYVTHNMADSRPQHLYYNDLDRKLYLSGYTDGGNSIFRYNPVEIRNNSNHLQGLSLMDNEHKPHYDQYSDTYNMHGARAINFIARIDPSNGNVEKGEFVLARLSNGHGNTLWGRDIAAGTHGQVFVAQTSSASFENRDKLRVNGQQVAGYGGGDAVLLGLPQTFGYRQIWHHFQKTSGHNEAIAVAANSFHGKSLVAFLAKSADSQYITVNPLAHTGFHTDEKAYNYLLVVHVAENTPNNPPSGIVG